MLATTFRENTLQKKNLNMTNIFDKSLNGCKITDSETGFLLVANAKAEFICKYKEYIKDEASFFLHRKDGRFDHQSSS